MSWSVSSLPCNWVTGPQMHRLWGCTFRMPLCGQCTSAGVASDRLAWLLLSSQDLCCAAKAAARTGPWTQSGVGVRV